VPTRDLHGVVARVTTVQVPDRSARHESRVVASRLRALLAVAVGILAALVVAFPEGDFVESI
jgi:hypothetical protein